PPQTADDFVRTHLPLRQRFECNKHPALIGAGIAPCEADHGLNRRVLLNDVHELVHLYAHGVEGNVLRGLYRTAETSRVLLRKKSLGHDVVEIDAEDSRSDSDKQGQGFVAQHPAQAAPIAAKDPVEDALAPVVKTSVALFAELSQKLGAHGRRSREGN